MPGKTRRTNPAGQFRQIDEKTVEITLTQGRVALIDARDAPLICQFVWTSQSAGYAHRREKGTGKYYLMHRVVAGAKSGDIVDHKNFNRLDNRRENLQITTNSINMRRRSSVRKGNKSGYHGVRWRPEYKSWQAQIMVMYKFIVLGSYKKKSDAIAARKAAEVQYGFTSP